MAQTLDIQHSLSTKLSKRMQQAIHMLTLPHQDMSDLIQTYVESNPFLEIKDTDFDNDGVSGTEDSGFDNVLDTYENRLWADGDESQLGKQRERPSDSDASFDYLDNVQEPTTLKAYLAHQIHTRFQHPKDLACATFFLDLLDEASGFLPKDALEHAHQEGHTQAQSILNQLQILEPVGVFSRSMRENLEIQLNDRGYDDPIYQRILEALWPKDQMEPVSHTPDHIARSLKMTPRTFQDYMRVLQNMPLRPGASFQNDAFETATRIPDVLLRIRGDGAFMLELNPQTLPSVYVNSAYYIELKHQHLQAQDRAFIHEKYTEAKWLLKSVHQRAINILKVCECILSHQESFFRSAGGALAPLTLKHVAEDTDLSESTVSRITQGKYMQTPRGLCELKYFFSKHIQNSLAPTLKSAKSIQNVIADMIQQEDTRAPLSDQQIVEALHLQGVYVARRTVAKYRDILGIGNTLARLQTYRWMSG